MARHFIIIFFFCALSTFSQKADGLYEYTVCVHQKLKSGTAYRMNEIIIRREDKTPYIEGIVWDLNKNPILTSTISLTNSRNDSLIKQIVLDTNFSFSFDNLNPGKYNVSISSKGYVSTKMINISVDKENALPFVFRLGNNDMFITTTFKSPKKLNDKKINKRIKEIEADLNI